jgi:hypothetical protein
MSRGVGQLLIVLTTAKSPVFSPLSAILFIALNQSEAVTPDRRWRIRRLQRRVDETYN